MHGSHTPAASPPGLWLGADFPPRCLHLPCALQVAVAEQLLERIKQQGGGAARALVDQTVAVVAAFIDLAAVPVAKVPGWPRGLCF